MSVSPSSTAIEKLSTILNAQAENAQAENAKADAACEADLAPAPADPVQAAKAAGLRYVTDQRPGIRRRRVRNGFRYLDANGKPVREPETLARIRSLVIPPAWQDVWISPLANGHLQATGRDAKGRKQSRYHPSWRKTRDETKYERMKAFAEVLPVIRARVDHDLALPGLPRNKVLATVVRLLETTYIRVGNESYARTNHSYGLTTMRTRHVEVEGSKLTFNFKGKSGVLHAIDLRDRRLARIVKRCLDLPGYELFQYLDSEGQTHSIDASDVNDYLREITQQHFTAKDFRTWAGTVLACSVLREFEAFASESEAKRNIVQAIKSVASRLGNTPAVCRKCYIHPLVLEHYVSGTMAKVVASLDTPQVVDTPHQLREEELRLMRLFEAKLA